MFLILQESAGHLTCSCCSAAKSCQTLQLYCLHAAGQASLSLIISQSLHKFMSIKLVIPFNHLESPFNSQEIKPVNLKGNQP